MRTQSQGFTLIELLVVVAIIGILASVVLASLNSAREKGKVAAIKSNLKNMGAAAELSYVSGYTGINTTSAANSGSTTANVTTCADTLSSFATSMENQGATVRCFSTNWPSANDAYQRWGATALFSSTASLVAYSASQNGVVTWDETNISPSNQTWANANTLCANAGKRLPAIEELFTLSQASFVKNGSYTPPGFSPATHWSSTPISRPGVCEDCAYYFGLPTGTFHSGATSTGRSVRCVY